MEKIRSVCIKGDIISFRVNRKDKELRKIVDQLNREFKMKLIRAFMVCAGDEFIGIVSDFRSGYEVFKE